MAEPDSDYSGGYDVFTDRTAKQNKVTAERWNYIQSAIEAIQAALGLDIEGDAATLAARLLVSIATDGAIQKGTSFPGSPVAGQLFFRTDEDILYRRNAANGSWVQIGGGHARLSTTDLTAASNSGNITLEANKVYKVIFRFRNVSGTPTLSLRFNASSGTEYFYDGSSGTSLPVTTNAMQTPNASTPGWATGEFIIDTTTIGEFQAYVMGDTLVRTNTGPNITKATFHGLWHKASSPVTSFQLISSAASSLTGSIYVYEYVIG